MGSAGRGHGSGEGKSVARDEDQKAGWARALVFHAPWSGVWGWGTMGDFKRRASRIGPTFLDKMVMAGVSKARRQRNDDRGRDPVW